MSTQCTSICASTPHTWVMHDVGRNSVFVYIVGSDHRQAAVSICKSKQPQGASDGTSSVECCQVAATYDAVDASWSEAVSLYLGRDAGAARGSDANE